MRPDKHEGLPEYDLRRRHRFELFYFERKGEGDRYYLRFTGLALILVVCLTVIPTAAICALYLRLSRAQTEDIKSLNLNIEPRGPVNYGQIVVPTPMTVPTPPKLLRSQRGGDGSRQMPATPGLNANPQPTGNPMPSPTPPT
jgi:hypothetical protein